MISEARAGFRRERPADPLGGQRPVAGLVDALRLVLPYARRHLASGLSGLLATAFSIVLGYALPFVTRSLVDDAIAPGDRDALVSRLVLLAVLGGLLLLAGALQQYATTLFSGSATVDLQKDLVRRAMALPLRLFGRERSGYLMSRVMNDIQGVSWFLSGSFVSLAASTVRISAGVALMFSLEWRLALISLPSVALLPLAAFETSRRLRNLGLHSMEEGARVSRDIQEALSSSTVVRAFAAEERVAGRIDSGLGRMLGLLLERSAASSLSGIVLDLVPGVSRLVAIGAGASLVIGGELTLGSLLAFTAILGSTLGPARQLASAVGQIPQSLAAVDRTRAVLEASGERPGGTEVSRLRGGIEFRDVSFDYGEGRPVLQDLSFRVGPGCRLGVTGASGEGKTTLLMLLLGFYAPVSGSILLDGVPLPELDIRSVRSRLGFVPQEPAVLSGTLLENIRLGDPDVSEEAALEACRTAGMEFVRGTEDLGIRLGEDGYGLSQGQKQRLALARALAVEPDILLLDEPTSALDAGSEEIVVKMLSSSIAGRTAIVVTHSPALLELADAILVLDGSTGILREPGRVAGG